MDTGHLCVCDSKSRDHVWITCTEESSEEIDYHSFASVGCLSDIFLFLVHESNFDNQDKVYRLGRVLLFACHPQRLYYEPVGSALVQLQDSISLIATKIAQDGTPCINDYFRNKKWKNESDLWRQIEIKALSMAFRQTFDTLQFVAKTNSCRDHVLAVADQP